MNRAWRIVCDLAGAADEDTLFAGGEPSVEAAHKASEDGAAAERHRVVGKVIDDFDRNNFNTAHRRIMELCNATSELICARCRSRCALVRHAQTFDIDLAETIVKLPGAIAPHWARSCGAACWATGIRCMCNRGPSSTLSRRKPTRWSLRAGERQGEGAHHRGRRCRRGRGEVRGPRRAEAAIAGKDVKKVVVVPGRLVNIVAK